MKYRTLSLEATYTISANCVVQDRLPTAEEIESSASWCGNGLEFPDTEFEECCQKWEVLIQDFGADTPESKTGAVTVISAASGGPITLYSIDEVEGWISVELYDVLSNIEVGILENPGFWRYLSMRYGWEIIKWREHGSFERALAPEARGSESYLTYLDARRSTEAVFPRMYIRGRLAVEAGSRQLGWSAGRATDLWRSHITRVQTGFAPNLAGAFVGSQTDNPMATLPLREFAKRLNRLASNVLFPEYSKDDASRVIEELREGMQGWSAVDR